jgi:SAM-dependent methyltransferase
MNRRALITRLPRFIRNPLLESVAFIRQQRRDRESERPPLDYWVDPPGSGHGNSPEAYAESTNNWDAEWMLSTALKHVPTGTVLEFGCNAGRVLHYFAERYKVIGLELNPKAVELARQTFPNLREARLLVGNGEETLRTLPTGSVDVSYSSHALRHVGPSLILSIAQELTRVTTKLLIISEDEGTWDTLNFPRNYRRLFEQMGWHQTEKHYAVDLGDKGDLSLTSVVRVFRRS